MQVALLRVLETGEVRAVGDVLQEQLHFMQRCGFDAFEIAPGTPLERTADVAAQIDAAVQAEPEVERTALTVGAEEGASTSISAGEHTARLTIKLKAGLPAFSEPRLIERIRDRFRTLPAAKLEISYPTLFSFKSPVEVEIRGHDLATLKRLSREAETLLTESVPGLADVRSTLQSGHPEIQVVYKRDRLAEYGLNLRTVADLVRNKVQGRIATEFRKEDQMIDIVVRLREQDRFGIEELRGLIINPNGAVPIPLSVIADLTINEGPSEIRRVDQQRTALITANLREADLATVSRDIVTALDTMAFPAGFTYVVAGQNKEMQTSLNSLLLAFGLALFLVYIVMASQFESLLQPLMFTSHKSGSSASISSMSRCSPIIGSPSAPPPSSAEKRTATAQRSPTAAARCRSAPSGT